MVVTQFSQLRTTTTQSGLTASADVGASFWFSEVRPRTRRRSDEDRKGTRRDQARSRRRGGGVFSPGKRRSPTPTGAAARHGPVRHAEGPTRGGAAVFEPGAVRLSELHRRRGGALAAEPGRHHPG